MSPGNQGVFQPLTEVTYRLDRSLHFREPGNEESLTGVVIVVFSIKPAYITLQNVINILKVIAALLLCEIRRSYYD